MTALYDAGSHLPDAVPAVVHEDELVLTAQQTRDWQLWQRRRLDEDDR